MKIPKRLGIIWIGQESKRPDNFIQTWKDKNPAWEFTLYDNDTLNGRTWKNQGIIDQYLKEKRFPGVADVMRYELLYEYGGLIAPADSICLEPIGRLMTAPAVAVYENETVRPGFISPLYASVPKGKFVETLINNLPDRPPIAPPPYRTRERPSRAPVQVTGNKYMKRIVENYKQLTGRDIEDDLKIKPSYVMNPIHYTGHRYTGKGKVYAVQQWGATSEAGIGIKKYEWSK